MRKILLSISITLVAIGSLQAQFSWSALNGPFGGRVNDMVRHSSGAIIIGTETSGVLRSTDSGVTWTKIPTGSVVRIVDLDIDPLGTIYGVSGSSNLIFKSTDGGASFSQFTFLFGFPSKIKAASATEIYAANGATVYKSTDSGTTFTLFSSVTFAVTDLDFVAGSPTYLYISTSNGGVRVSTNSAPPASSGTGLSGSGLNVHSLGINSSGVAFALTSDGPYTSTNQGATWTSIKGTITDVSFSGVIGLDAANNLYLANSSTAMAYSSTNSGVTWSAGTATPKTTITSGLFLSATNWFLGTNPNGVLVTGNAGAVWTPTNSGFKGLTPVSLFALSNFPTNLYMTTQSGPGYYQSTDDGTTWNLNLNDVAADGPVYSFASPGSSVVIAATSTGVMRSTDQGANWATVSTNVYFQTNLVSGTNVTYTISASNTLETSINQGTTWTSMALTGFSGVPTGALFLDAGGSLYCRTTTNALYKINVTTAAATLLTVAAIDFSVVGNSVYALTNATTLNVSTDNGANWLASGLGSTYSATRIWALPNNVVLTRGTTNNVNYSIDNGANWTAVPLSESGAIANSIIASPAGVVYVATANSVVHKSPATVVPPAAPSTLTIIGSTSTLVDLHWIDNANNESSFRIQRSTGNNSSYVDFATGFVTNTNRARLTTGASPSTLYFYRVAAVNAAGQSAYSPEISFTTPPTCASPTPVPNNRSWTATAAADPGYTGHPPSPWVNAEAQITLQSTGVYLVSGFANGIVPPTVHPVAGTASFREECGSTYFASSNYDMANGNGTWNGTNTLVLKWQSNTNFTNQFKGTTTYVLNANDPIPATPTLNLNIFSSTSVFLYWNLVAFETEYKVYRSTTSGSGFVEVATVSYPTTFYVDKNLTSGTTYYYKITARNAAGESPQSPQSPVTPSTTTLFTPTENDISLNYDAQQGSSWADLDGDGDEDIATPAFTDRFGNTVPPNFYENLGASQFSKRTLAVLADENIAVSRGMGVFDFNNDGKLDVYVTRSGTNIPDLLLVNNGGWNFTKISVTETLTNPGTAFRGNAILDYDRDGYADIYASNDNGGADPSTMSSFLLKTNSNGTFTSIATGPHVTESNNARASSAADYDNDGDQDLFVLNWNNTGNVPNKLYRNNGDGTFTRVTGTIFDTDLFPAARSISWADIDNDGDLDLYVGSLGIGADRLYQNNGNGTFTNLTSSPVAEVSTSTFGSTFGDINNDGAIDLIVINSGANSIFLNSPTTPGVFTKFNGSELLTSTQINEIGGSMGDFDNDGFLDIYPGNGGGGALPNLLYRNNLTASASRNWIEVKLVGVLSNRAALGARVKVITTSPARTQIREVAGLTGYGGQNSLIQHFGLGTASTISQMQITWPSGKVMNLTNVAANQILTLTEDGDGPTITLSPANGLTNVVPTNTISITVADASLPISRVAGKKLTIVKTATPGTPVKIWDIVTDATVSGNTYTFTLPATMEFSTQYSVSIDAGAVRDFYENTSLAVAAAGWTFTTQAEPDVVSPVFAAFTPQAFIPFGTASAQQFSITATDNNAVTTVKMFHRKISQTAFVSTLCTAAPSNAFTIGLQSNFVDDMGVQYYFKAYDAAGNVTRSPSDSSYYVTRIVFNNQNIGIPVTSGGEVNDYQIVAVPFELESQQVQFIFEELGSPDKTKWRLLKYQHSPQAWIDYPSASFSNIKQGEGYFVNSRAGQNIAFGDAVSPAEDVVKSPNNHQGSLFELNLKQGWNLIGNPYALKIFWDQSKPTGVGPLKIYSGGTYTNAPNGGELDRLKGGFVLADNDVVVPVKFNVTASGGRIASDPLASSDLTQPAWAIQLNLEQQKAVNTLGGIGMHPDALLTKDDFDDVNPPRLQDQLEINFAHPEYFLRQFSRDVVPTQHEYQWEFVVHSNLAGSANLSWDNSMFGTNDKDLFLLDVSRQRLTDMREINTYAFDPTVSHTFRVYFGDNLKDKIKPERVALGDAFPNPASRSTVIPFVLPENGGEHSVRLEVYNMMGQPVATLVDGQFKAGFYSVEWDVDRSSIVSGLYLYRMKVSGAEVVTKKIVVDK